jgi:hypothetical protein
MSQELIEACKMNKLPSLSVMCDYGLDGRDGVNPLALFDLYRKVIYNFSAEEIEQAMKTDNLASIVGVPVRSGWGR